MDQLLPDAAGRGPAPGVARFDQSQLVDAYLADERPAPAGRPWVALSMVTSIDGATSADGRSGGLSSPADKAAFFAMRSVADVVLVGAGTVRAESYGPTRAETIEVAWRRGAGKPDLPRIAVVTGRLDLAPDARIFSDQANRPIVVTVASADPARREALSEVAEVVDAGATTVDPALLLAALAERGARVVTCEGGPTLNGQLIAAGLVDEVCVSIAPILVGGSSGRLAHGPEATVPEELELRRVVEHEGFLFLRYAR